MAAGCFIWGVMAIGFAFTNSVYTVGRWLSVLLVRTWHARLRLRACGAVPPHATPPSLPQGMFVWAFNGVGLGLLLPNAQVWGAAWLWGACGVFTVARGGIEECPPLASWMAQRRSLLHPAPHSSQSLIADYFSALR